MVKPRCPLFGTCGGCSFQDLDYMEQAERKREALEGAAGVEAEAITGPEYGYRNRMDMIFTPKGIGFRRKGTWDTPVDVRECPISNKRLNELILEVREAFPEPDFFDLRKHTGTLRYAVIRTPSLSSSVSLVLNPESPGLEAARNAAREFAQKTSAGTVLAAYVKPNSDVSVSGDFEILKGEGVLRERLAGRTLEFGAQGFFQNNSVMAEKMHEYVSGLIRPDPDGHFLDLYGGVGAFGIVNAGKFGRVTIAEGSPEAVGFARKNIRENRVRNAEAVAVRDRDLKSLGCPEGLFLLADPPRAGLHPRAVRWILKARPERMVYISCNTKQLERDLKKLSGYRVESAAMLDFFPQTPHAESVLELKRE